MCHSASPLSSMERMGRVQDSESDDAQDDGSDHDQDDENNVDQDAENNDDQNAEPMTENWMIMSFVHCQGSDTFGNTPLLETSEKV